MGYFIFVFYFNCGFMSNEIFISKIGNVISFLVSWFYTIFPYSNPFKLLLSVCNFDSFFPFYYSKFENFSLQTRLLEDASLLCNSWSTRQNVSEFYIFMGTKLYLLFIYLFFSIQKFFCFNLLNLAFYSI